MKEKARNTVTVILAFFCGIIGTIIVLKYIPQNQKQNGQTQGEQTSKTVNITETNTLKSAKKKYIMR